MTTNEYMSAEELGVQNHICLLEYGKENRNGVKNWTTEDLKPYLKYLVNDEAVDTLFNGIIFNPISGRDNHYIFPMYTDFGNLPQKKDWKLALKWLFKSNHNLDAVSKNTAQGKKTDIWVTMPYPYTNQTNFGELDDRSLNFNNEEDRVRAIQWWISKFLSKWNDATYLHEKLAFKGFVWQRASIPEQDENLVKRVTSFIHEKGLLSLWLQQYGSTGCINWKEFGFDAACTHPNYYGETGPDYTWIPNTTVFAKYYHTGIQIPFGKGILFKEGHLLDYLNFGYFNEYMHNSLLVFQFPNQTMREIYENHLTEYIYLYSFIKKTYKPVYPTAAFPS
ncbi:DUF4855 domain-containing protein [Bacillus sp. HNG]|uniref:DUF4855 domain-containing protein n=1 Tax=Bacillus sp. HNG TaxID=2293325 RepID=UPI00167A4184|nr:DUF4855 domain-containing protein [Bacillus sp. HNG]